MEMYARSITNKQGRNCNKIGVKVAPKPSGFGYGQGEAGPKTGKQRQWEFVEDNSLSSVCSTNECLSDIILVCMNLQ